MPLIWNDNLATGVRQIDLQHQELIELINELEAACTAGHQAEALEEVLPRLGAYVLFHFGTEEAMLPSIPTEHAQKHRAQHAEFSARVAALRVAPGTNPDLCAFTEYLKRWLVDHIMKTDHELGRLMLERRPLG
jgi:hemerythrin